VNTEAGGTYGGSEETLRRLQAVTDAALSRLGLQDLLTELLERTRELMDADIAAILMLDPTGNELIATAASGLEQEVWQGVRVPVGQGFSGRVAAQSEPIAIEHLDQIDVLNPILLAKNVRSMLGVPMIDRGRVVGVLNVGTLSTRQFTPEDIQLLQLVADRASLAAQARLTRLDRAATVALQHSLLPTRPHAVAGLDVAARYVPGAEVGVGGDWYDLFAVPSGHVGIVIGDVAGNGLHAAVVMGRIRSALRAYALETNDPADVLTRLDRKIQVFEPGAVATVLYAVLDPDRAGLTVSSAGHLPPVLTGPRQPTQLVKVDPDLPLGAFDDVRRHSIATRMEAGNCLFFYTDGLVERRDRLITDGIDLLVSALDCSSADGMCASAMAALLPDTAATDDVAILAVRLDPAS
jgi:serine phosphatase RsbU (regulator of sigma subunit)